MGKELSAKTTAHKILSRKGNQIQEQQKINSLFLRSQLKAKDKELGVVSFLLLKYITFVYIV